MSRGHDTRGRRERERRNRDDRPREPRDRDAYHTTTRGGVYPHSYSPEYTSASRAYETEPEYGYKSSRRSARGEHALTHRHAGLNEDYYNPPSSDSHDSSSRRRSRRDRDYDPDRPSRRRTEDDGRYDNRRHNKHAPETEGEEEYYQPQASKSRRRVRTEPRGRSGKRHDDVFTDQESEYREYSEPEERPAKPSRRKSFLQAIGIGKTNKHAHERERARSSPAARSPSRGSARRDYSFSPSPTRRHRSAGGGGKARGGSAGRDLTSGLKRSNTNWQRAAGSAMRAGATAAYELRHDPSPWVGPKGFKVATAALGAAVMDNFLEEKQSKKSGGMRQNAARQLGEAALLHLVSGGSDRGRSKRKH